MRTWSPAGRVCDSTGSIELLDESGNGRGCPTHRGSSACLRTARELWDERRKLRVDAMDAREGGMSAVQLLDEFDREAMKTMSDGEFGYAGSPFARRVHAALIRAGKRKPAV